MLFRLVDISDFSKKILLYSGLVITLPRCRDDISLCESGDVDLSALSIDSWRYNQVRDTRRWEGEEKLRLFVLRRALVKFGVTLGNGVMLEVLALTR